MATVRPRRILSSKGVEELTTATSRVKDDTLLTGSGGVDHSNVKGDS